MKRILGISLLGLIIAFGCSREPINTTPVDLHAAIAQAKAENKTVLLDFTGSDWCPPCMELHRKIFSRSEFRAYAQSNLIFITVDFPQKFQMPPDTKATNDLLSTQFAVEGFPTLVALDGSGNEIWRHLGYLDGGFKELQSSLDTAKPKAK